MASEYETVSKVIDDFAYLITLGNIRPAVATNIKSRIEAAHKRKVAELERKARDAIIKYRAEKARHTDTYKYARIKAQDEEIATLKRKIAELRECLKETMAIAIAEYHNNSCFKHVKCGEIERCKTCKVVRWRRVLEITKGAKDGCK